MKRVVTYIVPIPESGSADSGGITPETITATGEVLRFDPGSLPGGGTKVEVVVSDEQAARILAAVLEHGATGETPTGRLTAGVDAPFSLELMVRKELAEADPAAQDLLERIVQRVEKQLISQVYDDCDHVKSRAAARLGINRNTLLKKLRQFGQIIEEETGETDEAT